METSFWDRMLERRISRRTLIKATAAVALGASACALPLLNAGRRRGRSGTAPLLRDRFTPIDVSTEDELVLPREFSYRVLLRWGDPIDSRGERFGTGCDFNAFLPLAAHERVDGRRRGAVTDPRADHRWFAGDGTTEGLLVVNHEYPDRVFLPSIEDQKQALGVSVVHLERDRAGVWRVALASPYARRYTATSPARLVGPAAGLGGPGGEVLGTMGNCSGGVTPWGTVLSCEEITDWYTQRAEEGGYGWGEPYTRLEHYSWVVEVDPFDPEWVPLKRTALGRFQHENAAIRVAPDGRLVLYMGDDRRNGYVYKFVSEGRYDPARGRANGDLLDRGRLHVARCFEDGSGAWTPLPATEECLRDTHAYILAHGHPATPMDRPEDLEIHPADGSVYVALTNNTEPAAGRVIPPLEPDPYGKIARFVEEGGDPAAPRFHWEVFAVGGPDAGFAAPDNLEFDRDGNLWIVSDFSSGPETYAPFGNNGMFMVATRGPHEGIAFQFASAPVGAELTGPWLAPDEATLFLSVQHPGEGSPSAAEPTSRWPDHERPPRSACVLIGRRTAEGGRDAGAPGAGVG